MGHLAAVDTNTSGPRPARADVHARTAIYVIFGLAGLAFANWVSRVPAVRDALHLSPGQVGLLLLSVSAGSLIAMPLAGMIVNRIGPARTITASAVLACAGLVTVGFGAGSLRAVPVAALGMLMFGIGNSVWDVAMNIAGADVERRLNRSIMPRFHAAFSLGTVTGAGLGALASAQHMPLNVHLSIIAVVILAAVLIGVRWVLPLRETTTAGHVEARHPLAAWLEPRTLLIGLFTLTLALTEGSANDWLGLALADGYDANHTVSALGFGLFVTAMTIGRVSGTWLLDRFGRVRVLRVTIGLAVLGLLLFTTGTSLVIGMLGALVWGLGASLGFPVGMSAAADDPARAAARVSVVSSIAYTSFLAGPPLLGLLGDHLGTQHALFAVLGALVVGFAVVGVIRPPRTDAQPSGEPASPDVNVPNA